MDMGGGTISKDGDIVEQIPTFSELFPDDWEVPTVSTTEIDLSYYGQ